MFEATFNGTWCGWIIASLYFFATGVGGFYETKISVDKNRSMVDRCLHLTGLIATDFPE